MTWYLSMVIAGFGLFIAALGYVSARTLADDVRERRRAATSAPPRGSR